MKIYLVTYSGTFGFIKPWTAVRDIKTFSQQFLTPSIIEGIRQKLEVSIILRHRLRYKSISEQQERTQARAWTIQSKKRIMSRNQSVLIRGILINPILVLAFNSIEDAEKANTQHICLCRNEDILLPDEEIIEVDETEFDSESFPGFELRFEKTEKSFIVGYNRFNNNEPMYGWIHIVGNPLESNSY